MGVSAPSDGRLKEWLTPVVDQMVAIRQLGDLSTDPITYGILEGCASLAYSQVCAFTRREFMFPDESLKQFIREEHPNGTDGDVIRLRNTPVEEVAQVLVVGGPELQLVSPADYYLVNNRITGVTSHNPVHVLYTGGWKSSDENITFRDILTHQALANYHRRDIVGISSISLGGGGGSSMSTNSDEGGLLKVTRLALETYIYFGEATLLDSEAQPVTEKVVAY